MSDRLGSTLIAVIAGAVVGAGLGVLFAPEEGRKTRRKIQKSFDSSKEEFEDKIDELKKQVRSVVERKKNDFEGNFDEFISTTGKKRDEVISALEKKLAELKKETHHVAEQIKK
ncbi:YtxH domain-containing protein [Myroides sp. LJL116]